MQNKPYVSAARRAGMVAAMISMAVQVPPDLRPLARFDFGKPLRVQNPAVAGVEEVIDAYLYDSFSVAANTGFPKVTLFGTPISGAKTIAQTNMRQAGHLESGDRFQVYSLQCFVGNDTVPVDLNNMLRNISVIFTVRSKPYFEGPMLLLPAGCGAVVQGAAQLGTAPAGAAATFSTSNGPQDPRAIFTYGDPIPIQGEESFAVTINPETAFNLAAAGANPAGAGTTVYVLLAGKRYRGVS